MNLQKKKENKTIFQEILADIKILKKQVPNSFPGTIYKINIPVKDNMILPVQQWRPLAEVRQETKSPGSEWPFYTQNLL